MSIDRQAASIADVRHILRQLLSQWNVAEEITRAAELMASELLANALRHGQGSAVAFSMMWLSGQLVLMVSDGSAELPVMRLADHDDESGRGLELVDATATTWGTTATRRGKAVWAVVSAAGHVPT